MSKGVLNANETFCGGFVSDLSQNLHFFERKDLLLKKVNRTIEMFVGKVTGSIVSTRKNEKLIGSKFMIVESVMNGNKETLVAVDNVGAGIGEIVLVATGSAARIGCNLSDAPVDAAIVGIVDEGVGLSGV